MAGPLAGIRIIEIAGMGPGPFAAMMLADHGAEVIRIERPGALATPWDILLRSRRSIALDLKRPEAVAVLRDLVCSADGLIEGFRPGVMERLGLGPDVLIADCPSLIYGRMTGWGQDGPMAHAAGHDINYIALAGNLHTYGRAGQKPTVPLNVVGDFGGGGMMLAFGMLAALLAVRGGAPGQVVDCAMIDGAAVLGAMTYSFYNQGGWHDERGVNLLDGGAPFYDSYATSDGRWVAFGALEPHFYATFLQLAGVADDPGFDHQYDRSRWPALRARLTALFASKSRDEWCTLLEGSDACFAPILSLAEAPLHPHLASRATFVTTGGKVQPAPAPRYSGSPTSPPVPPSRPGADRDSILGELGYDPARIAHLASSGALG